MQKKSTSQWYAPSTRGDSGWRFLFVVLCLLLITLGIAWRLFHLNIVQRDFLLKQGNARTLRVVDIPAYRGMITDRNGQPLAISTPVHTAWANPRRLRISAKQKKQLARLLNFSEKKLKHKLKVGQHKSFIYLRRHITPDVAKKIQELKVQGIHLYREYKRFYPEGEVFAPLIGFTNIDDHGQEGIELAYDQTLGGLRGKKKVVKDRLGRVVAELKTIRRPRAGEDLTLSIDKRLQYLAYRRLKSAIKQNKAVSGAVVTLDARTGEVLVMANYPTFNPNNRPDKRNDNFKNRAVTDLFEPASTIKTFAVAAALSSGKYQPETIVDTHPGYMILNGKRIIDHRNLGKISVTDVLKYSSNMGVSKMMLSLSPDRLPSLLDQLGFGHRTVSGFPGESTGIFQAHRDRDDFMRATLSFGYGISVNTLQLAKAYLALANHGYSLPISLLKQENAPPTKRVLPPKVADSVLRMLESVVTRTGTASRARVQGYHVSGKTGTARLVGRHGYLKNRHNALFVGVAPARKPRLVTAVFIHDPRGKRFYGGDVAAPVFAKVMHDALRVLDVSPDDIPAQPSEPKAH